MVVLVVNTLLGGDPLFQAAVMTMVVLPAPFVAPLFMGAAPEDERTFVVNTLSLMTLVTLRRVYRRHASSSPREPRPSPLPCDDLAGMRGRVDGCRNL